ncbi:hypothetical protein ACXR2U_17180 [Jatrophihabitans sp. YIM 134969]
MATPLLVAPGPAHADPVATASAWPGGTYVAVAPARVLDTRAGLGASSGATTRVDLTVAGRGGLPTGGIGAVVLNVTVTGATGSGFLAVSPTGTTPTSNVNYAAGRSVAQLVTSKVDVSGRVVLTSSARVQVIADVVGWFTDSDHAAIGSTYQPSTPRRLFDSRVAGSGGQLIGGRTRRIALASVPAGATAVAVNLTGVGPTGDVYMTAWGSGARPGTSSINVSKGDVRSNRAIVPIAPDRSVTVFLDAGRSDLVVDLSGWFTTDTTGSRFVPLDPARLGDTRDRNGSYFPGGFVHPYYRLLTTVPIAGTPIPGTRTIVPPTGALFRPTAAWLSLTVVSPRSHGWLAAAPTRGSPQDPQHAPGSSDVNFDAGVTPNAVLAALGDRGMSSTTTNVFADPDGHARAELVVDIAGIFVQTPQPATGLWSQGGAAGPDKTGWNSRVPGVAGDVVAVAGAFYNDVVTLLADGTTQMWNQVTGVPTPLVTNGLQVAATLTGVYVVRADGSVWTDDYRDGMRGVPGEGHGFGAVAGLHGVRDIVLGDGGAEAVLDDGSVVKWGGPITPAPTPVTGLRGPVHNVVLFPGDTEEECVQYEDGSVDVRAYDGAWHRAPGLHAVASVAGWDFACYALDGAGAVHSVSVHDEPVVDETVPGITAKALAGGYVDVEDLGFDYIPSVRVLTVNGEVWDRTPGVDTGWVHVGGLDGATVIGGGNALVTWVPPSG